ncbi:hypothetical protein EK21DRAFT_83476 [Setomelanomma holmii]|uniref:Uncharacterized protein n=1 Tax=Setomelanomma holmii TaxID=210430 RepID=A0A9P4HLM3_9PLEO|nr:hypothetical protein EK21DRAFT_83476 [Setomelanomma holmii]
MAITRFNHVTPDDPPGPPPPGPPAPPLLNCDDNGCCAVALGVICDQINFAGCPGLGALGVTPLSWSGLAHPAPHHIDVCQTCLSHGYGRKLNDANRMGTVVANIGSRYFLCNDCERKEVDLYWQRRALDTNLAGMGGAGPGGVLPTSTLHRVAHWPQNPTTANPTRQNQDLCICVDNINTAQQNNLCHACRDALWQRQHTILWTTPRIFSTYAYHRSSKEGRIAQQTGEPG